MIRISDIEVAVSAHLGSPIGGIGQVGLPPIGPAMANAVAHRIGGVRLRDYPVLPERVLEALNA